MGWRQTKFTPLKSMSPLCPVKDRSNAHCLQLFTTHILPRENSAQDLYIRGEFGRGVIKQQSAAGVLP